MQPFERKINSMMSRKGERKLIPMITVSGLWLQSLGFNIDSKIHIEPRERELIIRVIQEGQQQENSLS